MENTILGNITPTTVAIVNEIKQTAKTRSCHLRVWHIFYKYDALGGQMGAFFFIGILPYDTCKDAARKIVDYENANGEIKCATN